MKKIGIVLIVLLAMSACKKDDDVYTIIPKLKNCRIEYLFFRDDILMAGNQSLGFPPNNTSYTSCSYNYDEGMVTRTNGGPIQIGFSEHIFSEDAYDSIVISGNAIFSYSKAEIDGTIYEDSSLNPTVFMYSSGGKIDKIIKKNYFHPNGLELNYTYTENLITETDSAGNIRRVFYFEDNNLIKVLAESYDSEGEILGRNEILFQEFDHNPNPFKGMHYVRGAFFRSFSNNNYTSYTLKEYYQSSNGSMELGSSYFFSMLIPYNSDGLPMFGDYLQ